MKIEVLSFDEAVHADDFLESRQSLPTQLPVWSELISKVDEGIQPYYLAASENEVKGVLPGFFVKTKYGEFYHSIPYPGGYGGIVAEEPSVYKAILAHLLEEARARDCVAVSISNQPWVDDLEIYEAALEPDYIFKNFVNYIDLGKELHFNKKIRWGLRKAREAGITSTDDISGGSLEAWYKIFEDLMNNYGSRHLPWDFFKGVADKMVPEGNAKYLFAELDGKIISGCLLLIHSGIIEYFHTAMDEEYRDLQPNSLLIEDSMNWGQANSQKIWNFQSTRVKGSTVHKFKLRWGAEETNHYYFTKVLGSIDEVLADGREKVREEYPFYYLLPVGAFEDPGQRFFEK